MEAPLIYENNIPTKISAGLYEDNPTIVPDGHFRPIRIDNEGRISIIDEAVQFFVTETKTSDYVIAGNEAKLWYTIYADATAGPMTITFPAAAAMVGKLITVTKTDPTANAVTLQMQSGQFLNGVNTDAISINGTQYNSVTADNDGVNYHKK